VLCIQCLLPLGTAPSRRITSRKTPYPFHISQKPRPQTHRRTILTTLSCLLSAYPRPHTEKGCRERPKLLAPYYRGRQNWTARHRLRRRRSRSERNVLRCWKRARVAVGLDEVRCEEPYCNCRIRASKQASYSIVLQHPRGSMNGSMVQVSTIVLRKCLSTVCHRREHQGPRCTGRGWQRNKDRRQEAGGRRQEAEDRKHEIVWCS